MRIRPRNGSDSDAQLTGNNSQTRRSIARLQPAQMQIGKQPAPQVFLYIVLWQHHARF
jgi:hypothetical protein